MKAASDRRSAIQAPTLEQGCIRSPAGFAQQAEVAERLSSATGRQIRFVNVPPEDAKRAQLAAGMPPYMGDAWQSYLPNGGKARFAERHAAIFRGEQPAPKI